MSDSEAREMARNLVRGSIIEDAAAQFIAQVLKEAHDSRIKPMRADIKALTAERDALAEKLEKAVDGLKSIAHDPYQYGQRIQAMKLQAKRTLAQITGETDE